MSTVDQTIVQYAPMDQMGHALLTSRIAGICSKDMVNTFVQVKVLNKPERMDVRTAKIYDTLVQRHVTGVLQEVHCHLLPQRLRQKVTKTIVLLVLQDRLDLHAFPTTVTALVCRGTLNMFAQVTIWYKLESMVAKDVNRIYQVYARPPVIGAL